MLEYVMRKPKIMKRTTMICILEMLNKMSNIFNEFDSDKKNYLMNLQEI